MSDNATYDRLISLLDVSVNRTSISTSNVPVCSRWIAGREASRRRG